MLSKAIAAIGCGMVVISGCMLDSMSNAPIWVLFAGVCLMGAAVMTNREAFR